MRYFIRIAEVKEKVDLMERQFDIISDNITKLKTMKNNLEWHGEAANQFYLKYDNYISELESARIKVVNSILFLASFYTKYGEEYLRLKNKYKSILNKEDYRYVKL